MSDLDAEQRSDLLRAIAQLAPTDVMDVGEALYLAIVTHLPAMVIVVDPQARIAWINHHAPDALGRPMYDFVTADQTEVRAAFERVVQTGRSDRFIGFGEGRRGPRSRYENWIAPITGKNGLVALVLTSRDVSEEWELYETLRDREQRLSIVLRAAGMGTWRFDPRLKTVELDEHARAIYGVTATRHDAKTFTTTHIHPDDRAEVDRRALDSAATRRPYVTQNRILRAGGEMRWVEITGSPVLDESNELEAMIGTVTDITERRDLEHRARQAQRLDAVGSLTAGIAHNFNNVLAAIMPALALIEREVQPSSLALVRGASLATERAADLVRQLMTFAGRNLKQASAVESPGALVERTVALCRSTFDRVIQLRVTIEPGLPAIRGDLAHLEQALLNLLLNARDAVSEAGRSEPTIQVHVRREPDAMVAIVVEDNGPGVSEVVRERIFDPFFTTKPVGAGTGLGLATAYAIAREHGGDLTCGGEVGRGARFRLLLPAVDAVPTTEPDVARAAVSAHGVVLVVDDDPFVRDAVARVLDESGFEAVAADSAERAMDVLAEKPGIDVVLLDLNMPGSSWRSVVNRIRSNYPKTRVVAFTGGVTARDDSVDGWLAKPAQPEAIIDAINHAIFRPER